MSAKIVVMEGERQGETIELPSSGSAVLGRDQNSDICIPDRKASRRHCIIEVEGEVYTIADLNSSNGTHVNGAQITKQALRDGDQIRIGATKVQFKPG